MNASPILWSASARSVETVVQRAWPVSLKAVVNSHSPAAELWSTWQNPAAPVPNRVAFPSFGNAVAAILPWRRKLRTAIERTQTPSALAVRLFSRGQRLILNSVGAFKALRSLSSCPRVKFCQEPARGIFETLGLSPVLWLPVAHGAQLGRRKRQSAVKG